MYTNHAEKRMQQRAISNQIAEAILAYGSVVYNQNGAEIYYLSNSDKKLILSELPNNLFIEREKLLDVYLVTKGSAVITVGFRTKKINRN